jgi:transaldolase
MGLISQIRTIYDNFEFETMILAASTRHHTHILQSALDGANVVTLPFKVLEQLFFHPLTDKGLAAFMADHQRVYGTPQKPVK